MKITDFVRKALSERNGTPSSSRLLPYSTIGFFLLVWTILGVLILLDRTAWDKVDGWMTWARDTMFVSVLPYISRVLRGSIPAPGAQGSKDSEPPEMLSP